MNEKELRQLLQTYGMHERMARSQTHIAASINRQLHKEFGISTNDHPSEIIPVLNDKWVHDMGSLKIENDYNTTFNTRPFQLKNGEWVQRKDHEGVTIFKVASGWIAVHMALEIKSDTTRPQKNSA